MRTSQTRREFLKTTAAGAASAGLASCATRVEGPAAKERRPNIVLIITDDQGYGDLGVHGNQHIRTPNIDRLAGESQRFERFYVCPVCAPTRACMLTGRYNYRTGAIDTYIGRAMMHTDEVTLAEVLRGAGYRTGIFGKWHLGDNYPMRPQEQGFEEVLMLRGGGMVQPGDPPGSRYQDPILQHNGNQKVYQGYCTDVFADAACDFMHKHRSRPFFVYLPTNAPHTPLQIDETKVKPYRDLGLDDTTAKVYAMVENVDQNVGKVLRKIDELGLSEETIVIFMTDNGPQQKRYNAGMRGLKGSVYNGGIRVPFFVRWPGKLEPGKVERLAAHIDVMPTLLDWCGVGRPLNVKLDGQSLAQPEPQGERVVFSQWHRGDEPIPFKNAAVITQQYKLVDGKELYDLKTDPAESKDIAASHPQIVATMRQQYEQWFADVTKDKRYLPPPRIVLGNDRENPSMLTRQDWRGPKAGWAKDSLGHWEVKVDRAGHYQIKLRFAKAEADGEAKFRLGNAEAVKKIKQGDQSCVIDRVELKQGEGRLEAEIAIGSKIRGVEYVDVKRI